MNRITLQGGLQLLQGMAYGLRQPTMAGSATIELDPGFDFGPLDTAMARLLGREEQFEAGSPDASEQLLLRLIRWYHGMARGQRTPLFEEHWYRRFKPTAVHPAPAFRFALPYLGRRIAGEVLLEIVSVANALIAPGANTQAAEAKAAQNIKALRDRLLQISPEGINAYHLMAAAHHLRVPSSYLLEDIIAFGIGANRRVMHSTITDATPALGARLARRKLSTAVILRGMGLPAPVNRPAPDEQAALRAARELGWPVVIKPEDQDQGRGVSAGIMDEATLLKAHRAAAGFSKRILVEKHVDGEDVRLTVLHGEVIKVMKRRAGGVTGDGTSTIAQLATAEENSESSRMRAVDASFLPVRLDEEAMGILASRKLSPQDVLPAGEFLALRRRGNVSAGGSQVVVPLADVHPDNLELAVRAARALWLDLAGVDLIFTDLRRSWLEAGATILEVNGMPQIGSMDTPEIYRHILQRLVPSGGRVPLHVVVVGHDEALSDARIQQLMAGRECPFLSARTGNWAGGRRVTEPFANGFDAARALLSDSTVDRSIVVLSSADVMQHGLPFDRADTYEVLDMPRTTQGQHLVAAAILRLAPGDIPA